MPNLSGDEFASSLASSNLNRLIPTRIEKVTVFQSWRLIAFTPSPLSQSCVQRNRRYLRDRFVCRVSQQFIVAISNAEAVSSSTCCCRCIWLKSHQAVEFGERFMVVTSSTLAKFQLQRALELTPTTLRRSTQTAALLLLMVLAVLLRAAPADLAISTSDLRRTAEKQ